MIDEKCDGGMLEDKVSSGVGGVVGGGCEGSKMRLQKVLRKDHQTMFDDHRTNIGVRRSSFSRFGDENSTERRKTAQFR